MSLGKAINEEQLERILDLLGAFVIKSSAAIHEFREEILGNMDRKLTMLAESAGQAGVDPFGMDPLTVRKASIGAAFLYKLYFRCETQGLEHLPAGPCLLVANHAGQLPIDAVMIVIGLLLDADPPRLGRSLVDKWIPELPFVSTLFSRLGVAVGTPENAELLLKRGAALLTFPEGMAGISKTVDHAYQLQPFGLGYMRLALKAKVPVVPIAVVGSEEQYPTLYNLKSLGKLVGLPSLPIWIQLAVPMIGLLPLPVKYRIRFGEPLLFEGDPDDEDAVIRARSNEVEQRIREMLDAAREGRRSVFY